MADDKTYISVRDAARTLEVHENTIRNWVLDGILSDCRVPGTSFLRLMRDEVDTLAMRRASNDIVAAHKLLEDAERRLRDAVRRGEEKLASREKHGL
jgi:excisionase family DNA binding protein